jgi:hypothetical protein
MENEKNKKENQPIKRNKLLSAKQIKSYANKELIINNNKRNIMTARNINIKKKEGHRPVTSFLSTNINNYRYLFDNNNKETINNANWVLNLRLLDTVRKNKKQKLAEPTFYKEDLDKYIKKKKGKISKSKSAFNIEDLPDLNKFKHIFKINNNNHGTFITKPLLEYQLSLRQNKVKILHKWNSNTSIKNKYYYSCIDLPKNKLTSRINNNSIMRPYKIEYAKGDYNGNKIIKKKYYKDKVKAFNIFGTHYSLSPYNDKYNEKNYTKIKEILNSLDKTQAKTWYQTSLRKYFSKDEKKDKNK